MTNLFAPEAHFEDRLAEYLDYVDATLDFARCGDGSVSEESFPRVANMLLDMTTAMRRAHKEWLESQRKTKPSVAVVDLAPETEEDEPTEAAELGPDANALNMITANRAIQPDWMKHGNVSGERIDAVTLIDALNHCHGRIAAMADMLSAVDAHGRDLNSAMFVRYGAVIRGFCAEADALLERWHAEQQAARGEGEAAVPA